MTIDLTRTLEGWRASLCPMIELAALLPRNPVAHKWKATYRSIVLRELVSWRVVDLLTQADVLLSQKHILGSVILLRSAFETLAVLIYLNDKTEAVISRRESFFAFCDTTSRLMLGSKDKSTAHEAINVVTLLTRCDKR